MTSIDSPFWLALINMPVSLAIILTGIALLFAAGVISFALLQQSSAAAARGTGVDKAGAIRIALYAELMAYARATILATSHSNSSTQAKAAQLKHNYFSDPVVFRSVASKIGYLDDVTLLSAIVVFYENLIHLNGEFQRITQTSYTAAIDPESLSYRLRSMCYNLAFALEEFTGNDAPKIPTDLKSTDLWDRKGNSIWNGSPKPATLIELLRAL